ncbi:MAG: peptidylprolyl isomerase [Gemmatimonadota bacterium]|nr:peptidylprolyl isomerase [Gemmatimonadota bacterium]
MTRKRNSSGSRRRLAALALMLLLFGGAPDDASAQENLVDRIVAIVGDSAVLLSDIIQRENETIAQGGALPPEGSPQRDSIRQQLLDGIINDQLLLQAAAQDTLLKVDEEQVEELLNEAMAQILGRFPNQAELERALAAQGMSLQSLRETRRAYFTQQQLVRLYVQTNIGQGAVEVTEEEMRAFFEANRASLEQRPATVTFKQILMRVVPSDSARAVAVSRAEELRDRARAGEDFAEIATAYSQDPGSAAAGGDLGWFRRGQMARAFEEAAFALPEGAVSDVVETEFGLHIILVERARPTERKARHILIQPVTDYADITRARELAEEIVRRAQSEEFQNLIDQYHDPETPDSATVPVREIAEWFPPAYLAALSQRQPGEIVGPVEFKDPRGQDHFVVIRIVGVREAGDYTLEDLEASIRRTLIQNKRVEALIEGLRARTYIEIKGF